MQNADVNRIKKKKMAVCRMRMLNDEFKKKMLCVQKVDVYDMLLSEMILLFAVCAEFWCGLCGTE